MANEESAQTPDTRPTEKPPRATQRSEAKTVPEIPAVTPEEPTEEEERPSGRYSVVFGRTSKK